MSGTLLTSKLIVSNRLSTSNGGLMQDIITGYGSLYFLCSLPLFCLTLFSARVMVRSAKMFQRDYVASLFYACSFRRFYRFVNKTNYFNTFLNIGISVTYFSSQLTLHILYWYLRNRLQKQ